MGMIHILLEPVRMNFLAFFCVLILFSTTSAGKSYLIGTKKVEDCADCQKAIEQLEAKMKNLELENKILRGEKGNYTIGDGSVVVGQNGNGNDYGHSFQTFTGGKHGCLNCEICYGSSFTCKNGMCGRHYS